MKEIFKVVQIGYGNAARIHTNVFYRKHPDKYRIAVVVDTDPEKTALARESGLKAYTSLNELLKDLPGSDVKNLIWDVCTPTETHYRVVREIVENGGTKILVEKPICEPEEIRKFWALLREYQPEMVVVENYLSSKTNRLVKEYAEKLLENDISIKIEFTKNRAKDILDGRFIDKKSYVWGYEGPHMLTCLENIDTPTKVIASFLKHMEINGECYEYQGAGSCEIKTQRGKAELYTSMEGEIKHWVPEFDFPKRVIGFGENEKYRIIDAEDENGEIKILGQYEPIPGKERGVGRIIVKTSKEVLCDQYIADNHMELHLKRGMEYLTGKKEENPGAPETAFRIVEVLNEIVEKAKKRRGREKN